ncbi:tegument protein G48 [Eptesicus fuscus gammaherpesvirus]|uniref:Tegument protein G48 n=1 Tax=vespertilionid gammaherpesvirus 3 TaxID=2846598 RepID=A0A2D0ZNX9_9GAMA|nr:tegument protein G48 [Eptesicus fuscus gammaherpesvirus]ATA58277.1 tegument protein G48 [Eptesicus fuscus gammaherpesvirus]WAH70940.1 tegument protein G48 UL92 [Eptesicus fuscus gammaherpesvirus]
MATAVPIWGVSEADGAEWNNLIELGVRNGSQMERAVSILRRRLYNTEPLGYLASLLALRQELNSVTGGSAQEILLESLAVIQQLAKVIYGELKDQPPTARINEIFRDCRLRLALVLDAACGCVDCFRLAKVLKVAPRCLRPPKLMAHERQCAAASTLTYFYNSYMVAGSDVEVAPEHIELLLIRPDQLNSYPYGWDEEVAGLMSCLNLCWLYTMMYEHATRGMCTLTRALEEAYHRVRPGSKATLENMVQAVIEGDSRASRSEEPRPHHYTLIKPLVTMKHEHRWSEKQDSAVQTQVSCLYELVKGMYGPYARQVQYGRKPTDMVPPLLSSVLMGVHPELLREKDPPLCQPLQPPLGSSSATGDKAGDVSAERAAGRASEAEGDRQYTTCGCLGACACGTLDTTEGEIVYHAARGTGPKPFCLGTGSGQIPCRGEDVRDARDPTCQREAIGEVTEGADQVDKTTTQRAASQFEPTPEDVIRLGARRKTSGIGTAAGDVLRPDIAQNQYPLLALDPRDLESRRVQHVFSDERAGSPETGEPDQEPRKRKPESGNGSPGASPFFKSIWGGGDYVRQSPPLGYGPTKDRAVGDTYWNYTGTDDEQERCEADGVGDEDEYEDCDELDLRDTKTGGCHATLGGDGNQEPPFLLLRDFEALLKTGSSEGLSPHIQVSHGTEKETLEDGGSCLKVYEDDSKGESGGNPRDVTGNVEDAVDGYNSDDLGISCCQDGWSGDDGEAVDTEDEDTYTNQEGCGGGVEEGEDHGIGEEEDGGDECYEDEGAQSSYYDRVAGDNADELGEELGEDDELGEELGDEESVEDEDSGDGGDGEEVCEDYEVCDGDEECEEGNDTGLETLEDSVDEENMGIYFREHI